MRSLPIVLCNALVGCTLALNFEECDTNVDCIVRSQVGKLYCTTDHLCVDRVPDEQICAETVGSLEPGTLLIGVVSDSVAHKEINNAIRLAVTEINPKQSAAMQPPIGVRFCDSGSDDAQTLRATQHAVDTYGAQVLIGPMTSSGVLSAHSYTKSKGVLVISPAATSVDLTGLVDDGLVWRTAPPDILQARSLAELAFPTGMESTQKVNVLHQASNYGNAVKNAFVDEYAKIGIATSTVVGRQFSFVSNRDNEDLARALNTLEQEAPSRVIFVTDTDAPVVAAMLSGHSLFNTTSFYFSDGGRTPALFTNVPSSVLSRIRGVSPTVGPLAGAPYTAFRISYIRDFNADPRYAPYTAHSYDAIYMVAVAAAATQGHVPSGRELAQALGHLRAQGVALNVGPAMYTEALVQMAAGGVRLAGASGPLEFSVAGDPLYGQYEKWCIDTMRSTPAFKTNCTP